MNKKKHDQGDAKKASKIEDQKQGPGNTVAVSEEDYHHLQRQVAEYKDKYLRLLAEFENARKRQERERIDLVKYANEGVMVDFLNIVDDLERSINAAQEKHQDYDAFLRGVEMVMKHVKELMKKHGVEIIDPVGKPFDPYAHEILAQEPSAEHEDGSVIEAFQKGYRIGEKVIRTAKVKIAVNKSDN